MKSPSLALALLILILGPHAAPLRAAAVEIAYQARVATTTGSFLSYSVPMGTIVTGGFLFQTTGIPDTNANTNRGHYRHAGTGGFSASFTSPNSGNPVNITILGSGSPEVVVEWFPTFNDTWRYSDGVPSYGTMSVNGVPNADVDLGFSMTKEVLFSSDANANPWTQVTFPPGTSHTFALSDPNGTILLQITGATAVPEPTVLAGLAPLLLVSCLVRPRRGGRGVR